LADRILVHFGVSDRAVLEIVAGREQAAGGLPVSLPAGMETIESHCQDAFDDYEPYVDSQGNVYRYGYGLRDWPGRLSATRARLDPVPVELEGGIK